MRATPENDRPGSDDRSPWFRCLESVGLSLVAPPPATPVGRPPSRIAKSPLIVAAQVFPAPWAICGGEGG
jgi:hypothetical protein